MGGEEFVIVFADINQSDLAKVSEKIRTLVEASALRLPTQDLKITISIGATIVEKSDTVSSIIERADDLMYQSKKGGKNRVTIG